MTPCLTAALVVAVERRSLVAAALGVCSYYFVYRSVLSITHTTLSLGDTDAALVAIQDLRRDYTLKLHPASAYVDEDTARELVNVSVYQVVPNTPHVPFLGAQKAFTSLPGPSVILLTAPPEPINRVQRFFVYHEAGHLTDSGMVQNLNAYHPGWRLGAAFLPCLVLTHNIYVQALIVICALAAVHFQSMQLYPEVEADRYAVERLLDKFGPKETLRVLQLLARIFEANCEDQKHVSPRSQYLFWGRLTLVQACTAAIQNEVFVGYPIRENPVNVIIGFSSVIASAVTVVAVALRPLPAPIFSWWLWVTMLIVFETKVFLQKQIRRSRKPRWRICSRN